ncbi:alkaline phosphatase family protein [Rubinisphaera italica]|uniref:Type I phosphodiesterase / nucleotide pyrophosphatase n=1 Tax=Rubinisphaera italica TaxID=2527969 RepID=A0A5C5XEL2_9PLAN|nr:alkaline phosphatase family protein [Rubinisphaera italica]TWT61546.1 Type I phosphodiesterase / nucleotide pyrophosphatase [Rubinisphaera italica]
MKKAYRRACYVVFVLSICLNNLTLVQSAEKQRHVVVVSIDGFAAYLVDDPKVPLPTIRKLASEGCLIEGGMTVSDPSVTWPNHTTLVTGMSPGRHGVLANGVLVRAGIGIPVTIDSHRDQSDLVRVPTIVDVAHAAGLTTAEVNWPCTRGSKSFDDQFPDVPNALDYTTPRLRTELIDLGLLSDETHASFRKASIVGLDYVWTEAACHLIRERKPNLMLVHLLNNDATHHSLGARTQAGYTANAYADMCLSRIISAIDDAGIREQTTLIVVADHGFTSTPQAIQPNVLLRQANLLTVERGKLTQAQVHVVPEGGIGLVYCTHPLNAPQLAADFKKMFIGQEGVADVLLPDRYEEVSLPHPRAYNQSPDAILVAKEGFAVSGSVTGETFVVSNKEAGTSIGSHGFLAKLPSMKAMCILSGAGIKSGLKLPTIKNTVIAPTVAKLLELDYPYADGKPLAEALNISVAN